MPAPEKSAVSGVPGGPDQLPARRTEGHAQTNFLCARRDGVLNEPVDPDRGHQQRDDGKPGQERGLEFGQALLGAIPAQRRRLGMATRDTRCSFSASGQ